jgi:hypothetical protein
VSSMSTTRDMPGDSQSLTFAGMCESLPDVNRAKLTSQEALNE